MLGEQRVVRLVTWSVVGFAAAIGLAGCAGLSSTVDPAGPETPEAPISVPATETAAAAPASNAPSAPPSSPPVATRTARLGEATVTAHVYPVVRRDRISTIDVELVGRDPDQPFGVDELSTGGPLALPKAPTGVKLIDRSHAKAYLVARTGEDDCVCSPHVFTPTSSHFWVSATFAAPPVDVTAVDLVLPGFGTVSDVPVV